MGCLWRSVRYYVLNTELRTSLVVQRLRIYLPMQGTWVQSLVQEDPICQAAMKPVEPVL